MGNIEILYLIVGVVNIILLIFAIIVMKKSLLSQRDDNIEEIISQSNTQLREAIEQSANLVVKIQSENTKNIEGYINLINSQISTRAIENEVKLENIRNTVAESLKNMSDDNSKQLEKMRATVDEKLDKTLNERLGQSFKLVNERLEQVYKGLGEMQNLASGVGDLKKVLSNVKTRGILGEVQLGNILEQILAPSQYEENVITKSTGSDRVEFAVRMPGQDDEVVYLPIDAKFPADTYSKLVEATEIGDKALIEEAYKNLEKVIKSEAKDIMTKYIEPPKTTDFAIMFLPFEGLYAEVIRRGLLEVLQRDYKVCIAGPTTMTAILNSLQMGFRTLAIEKRSSEVWKVLGAVKTEFEKFHTVLEKAQTRINQANKELDLLVGVRTRQINSKLNNVTVLEESQAQLIMGYEEE